MKVCLTLSCLLFLTALQDGDAGETRTAMEGTNITVACIFRLSGSRKFFCKKKCEGENILIETTADRAQRGRYRLQYEKKGYFESDVMYVSITELKQLDSGRYRCGLDKTWTIWLRYDDFYLVVTKASTTSEPNWTLQNFTSTFLTSTSLSFDGTKSLLLYVGLVLAVLIIMLAVALLIFYQRKSFRQQKDPPVGTDHTDFTMINAVYEEIREEDREHISSVYAYVQSNKPNAAESNEIYSLASCPQEKAKDDEVNYSEVQLSNNATSSKSACGFADNVTYSEPRVDMSSASHTNGSPPLYSTITLQE